MGRTEIVMRLLSAEVGIALHTMRSGGMGEADWQKMARKMGTISESPLFIDDSPNLTMMEIRAKCRRLKQRHDLRLIVVDYLQLMTSGKRVESRQQEVAEFSRSLKLLAKELDIPVIAISQLNRGPEQRTDKRPVLSDLRESGSIEQDADMVMRPTSSSPSTGTALLQPFMSRSRAITRASRICRTTKRRVNPWHRVRRSDGVAVASQRDPRAHRPCRRISPAAASYPVAPLST
jgi:hypothetical protein